MLFTYTHGSRSSTGDSDWQLTCGCRRPPKTSRTSLLAERMHGSNIMISKPQRELATNHHEQNNATGGSDAEPPLLTPATTATVLTGSGDASAVNPNVASAGSIESAIDSVISQARAEVQTVPDLPDKLPSDLLECISAIKDVVR